MPAKKENPGKGGNGGSGGGGGGETGGFSYSYIVVFGDSLSDNGNFADLADGFIDPAHSVPFQYDGFDGSVRTYSDTSFTDGVVYADTLAGLLSLEASYENYAFGGAEALGSKLGAGYLAEYDAQTYLRYISTQTGTFSLLKQGLTQGELDAVAAFDINLAAQVTRFLDSYKARGNKYDIPDGTLAVINIGANDLGSFEIDWLEFLLFGQVDNFADDLAGAMDTQARRLAQAGVDGIVLYTLPRAELFVGYDQANDLEREIARDIINTVNAEILQRAAALNADGIATEVVRVDLMASELDKDMQTYGFLYKGPYLYGYGGDPTWVEQADGSIVPVFDVNPLAEDLRAEQILFFDEIHPSGALHDMLAIFSAETLTSEEIFGSSSSNVILGSAQDNLIVARDGNDSVEAGGGNDVVLGGRGNDTLNGGDGSDLLIGGGGGDRLEGGAGRDFLAGSAGDDFLTGGADSDILIGGLGSDTVDGGAGADVFLFIEEALWGGQGLSSDLYLGNAAEGDQLYVFLTQASYDLWSTGTSLSSFGLTEQGFGGNVEVLSGVDALDDPGTFTLSEDLALRFDEAQLWGVV